MKLPEKNVFFYQKWWLFWWRHLMTSSDRFLLIIFTNLDIAPFKKYTIYIIFSGKVYLLFTNYSHKMITKLATILCKIRWDIRKFGYIFVIHSSHLILIEVPPPPLHNVDAYWFSHCLTKLHTPLTVSSTLFMGGRGDI